MGNIFKTLGLDDLVRTITVIGKTAGDFLAGVPMGQKSGPGAGQGSFLGDMTTGKTEGRMSNEDYQFNQDLLDSSAPREAKRTNTIADITTPNEIKNRGAFLEGVAPAEANAYNTKQDLTYAADTQRDIARTKAQSEQLGMSPWELKGQSGATPLPSFGGTPAPQRQHSSGGRIPLPNDTVSHRKDE